VLGSLIPVEDQASDASRRAAARLAMRGLSEVIASLSRAMGRLPSDDEIAEALELTVEEYWLLDIEIMRACEGRNAAEPARTMPPIMSLVPAANDTLPPPPQPGVRGVPALEPGDRYLRPSLSPKRSGRRRTVTAPRIPIRRERRGS
jgi:hypothetical protein